MLQQEEINKIEIRSEEVQEILGHIPSWIIRAGISVIFIVIFAILTGSFFFKYPDIITAQIVVTTKNPPASLNARTNGKIQQLFVSDNQLIQQNTVLAILENTADYKDVKEVKNTIKKINKINLKNLSELDKALNKEFILGELQQSFSTFLSQLNNYINFIELDYYSEKIKSVKQQIKDYNLYYNRLWIQKNIQEKELKIAETQLERDKTLYNKGVYAKTDFEKAEKAYLQEKLLFENTKTTLVNTQMQINQIDQQILDLKLQKVQEENKQQIAIEEALQNLKSSIANWEKTYLIISPIQGKVTFIKFWSKNQNVTAGESVVTVVPDKEIEIIGKVKLLSAGSGKVKAGQDVNIKLDNFPYMEYGMIRAKVKSISLVPENTEQGAIYTAEIDMPDTLITNYGKKLQFTQEMTGTAEIITEDIKLIERFINPIKSLLKKNL